MKFVRDSSDDDDGSDSSEDQRDHTDHIFKKCKIFKQSTFDFQICQTDLTFQDLEQMISSLEIFEKRNQKQLKEIQNLLEENFNLKAKNSQYAPYKGKVRKLESQNSLLNKKTSDTRRENDMLVDKIQKLQKRLSNEQAVRVSVTEYDDTETDDAFLVERPAEIDSPSSLLLLEKSEKESSRMSLGLNEEYFKLEERRFHEAAEKIMRLEQRVITLQNANKLNSCASCGPLRNHVVKIEKQLAALVQERRGQLEELFELKQEALSSAVSEKDAHLAWLEVTGEGNIHTRGTIDRLRKERREILNRMKEENEKRMKMMTSLEGSSSSLFTGNIKISTLGSFGEIYNEETESTSEQAQSQQPQSQLLDSEDEDALSVKSL